MKYMHRNPEMPLLYQFHAQKALFCHSLPNSLTQCCLVNLIDVTLACEDGNSKLVEVVAVANVADEDCVGNRYWELRFGHKAKLLFMIF